MLDFGDELAAVEAKRADPHPPPFDADVARFDVALLDSWLAFTLAAFDAVGAKVMRLEFHKDFWARAMSSSRVSTVGTP